MVNFVLQISLGLSLIIFGTTTALAQQKKDPPPQSFKLIQKISQTKKIAPPETKPAYGGEYGDSSAWEYYNKDDYKQAIDLFVFALTALAQQKKDPPPQSFKLIQKTPQAKAIGNKSKKIAPPETQPAYGGKHHAGIAWEYYNKEDYKQAIEMFTFALSFPDAKQEAKLGLAFSYIKQKKTKKAISFFEELASEKYKLQAVLPSLIALLFEKGNYEKATFYLQGLEGKEKRKWEKLIREREMRKKFSTAQKSGDMHALERLINVYQKELKNCIAPELFYNTAKIFAIRGKRKEAKNIYENMLRSCSIRWDFRPAFLYALKNILPASDLVPLIREELKRPSLPPKYREQIKTFEVDLYKGIIDSLEPDSPQIKELAEKILAVEPEDPFTLTALAWWIYYNEDYKTAYEMFLKLNAQFLEEKGDKLEGLILSLTSMERVGEALKTLEDAKIEDNRVKKRLLKLMLSMVESSSSYAKVLAEKLLSVAPNDVQALTGLSWWNYHMGEYETAYKTFFSIHQKHPEKEGNTKGLIYTLIKLDRADEALKVLEESKIKDDALKKNILRSKFSLLSPLSTEVKSLAQKILEIDPEDLSAQSTLAWWHFRQKDYKTAHEIFLKLYQRNPQIPNYASALINVLVKLEDVESALKIIEQSEFEDEQKNKIMGSLYFNMASVEYSKNEFEKADPYLRKSLSLDPQHTGAQSLLMWSLFKQGRLDEALPLALARYEEQNNLNNAKNVLLFYEKLGRDEEAHLFVNALQEKGSSAYEKIISDYNFTVYRDKAKIAYENERYQEAETYFTMALIENSEDIEMKELLDWSKYRQTRLFKIMSSIEGLPGFTYGGIAHDLKGETGTEGQVTVNQGIDWVKLPGDIIFHTFAEYGYRNRTKDNRYYYERSKTLGLEFERSPFKLGTKYSWAISPEQNKTELNKSLYVRWYKDWYKFMKRKLRNNWLKFEAFSGSTYGRITNDLDDRTGTGISGYINQGIDWFTLPGDITFNTYAEYRYSFRTKDNFYYNAQSPGLGMMFTKSSFELGIEYFWKNFTEQNVTEQRWEIYLKWYYDWNVKSYINEIKKAAFRSRDYKERSRQHERRHEGR